MKFTIVLVEDDAEIAKQITELLNESDLATCAAVYDSAESALEKIKKVNPDVVIMDIHLPGMNGIECIEKLKPVLPQTEFIVSTSFEDTETVFKALKAGATGYLIKSSKASVILDGIEEVMRGGAPMSSQIARRLVTTFQASEKKSTHGLTEREFEIANLLASGYRYKQIADKLFISSDTVRTHIYKMYQKLQVNSRTEAINKLFK